MSKKKKKNKINKLPNQEQKIWEGIKVAKNCDHIVEMATTVLLEPQVFHTIIEMCYNFESLEWVIMLDGEFGDKIIKLSEVYIPTQIVSKANFERTGALPKQYRAKCHSHNNLSLHNLSSVDTDNLNYELELLVNKNTDSVFPEIKAWRRVKLPCGRYRIIEVDVVANTPPIQEDMLKRIKVKTEPVGKGVVVVTTPEQLALSNKAEEKKKLEDCPLHYGKCLGFSCEYWAGKYGVDECGHPSRWYGE